MYGPGPGRDTSDCANVLTLIFKHRGILNTSVMDKTGLYFTAFMDHLLNMCFMYIYHVFYLTDILLQLQTGEFEEGDLTRGHPCFDKKSSCEAYTVTHADITVCSSADVSFFTTLVIHGYKFIAAERSSNALDVVTHVH